MTKLSLAVQAHEQLLTEDIASRVVSMPSWDIFEHQTKDYRDSVLPPSVTARVAIEQASTFGWERYLGQQGFALSEEAASFSLAGAGRLITLQLLAGYLYAQLFAPKDKDYVALEPMTAPANALLSGLGLRFVEPGGQFRAAFRIRVDWMPTPGEE